MKSDKIYNVFDYWETAKYIHFGYYVGHYGYSILYKKEENKAYVMSGITDDLLYTDKAGTLLVSKLYSFDEIQIRLLYIMSLRNETCEVLSNLSEDDNPILLLLRF